VGRGPHVADLQHVRAVACGAAPPFGGKSEALWQETTAYQHFAVVDYNADPVVPGAGSAVFIHDDTGRPTIGCVSVAPPNLLRLLRWLDPSQAPAIVIGTEAEIRHF
jgi:L,D-peptidoglycan transpeptidase YkuD (ErfK/YbiS/YcfS/YnhG family)